MFQMCRLFPWVCAQTSCGQSERSGVYGASHPVDWELQLQLPCSTGCAQYESGVSEVVVCERAVLRGDIGQVSYLH
eukprot:9261154-Prorocentrum_lima.AAC.1